MPYGDVVAIAEDPAEFADAVMRVVENPDSDTEEARACRRERVAGDSWDAVAARVEQLLDGLMD